jgi:hypothetical protein
LESVGAGAIVIVDAESGGVSRTGLGFGKLIEYPLAFVETLGQSSLERAVHHLRTGGVRETTVLVHWDVFPAMPPFRDLAKDVVILAAVDVELQVALTLKEYAERGMEQAFIVRPNAYCEADLNDMMEFHRESRCSVSRASDSNRELDLWLIDSDIVGDSSVPRWEAGFLESAENQDLYFVKGHCQRIDHPRDLRRLVDDAFNGRCALRPSGKEIETGIWADEGSQIYRGARIEGPAYVGRACTLREDTLIRQCSNIENCSYIDYGTIIEDATILANTYVGIGLEVRESIVNANRVFNMSRDVVIELSDPNLFRTTMPDGKSTSGLGLMNLLKRTTSAHAGEAEVAEEVREQECFTNIQQVNTRTEFES